jgi:NADP-dependent 3-hydroxy acid dehydrogenase YdfG
MERALAITGASSGIGAATARAAAEAGWKVALLARSADKLQALVDELGADRAVAIPCDVTDAEAARAALDRAAAAWGRLDAVFANAGCGAEAAGTEAGDLDEWRRMVDLNVWGVLTTVKAALPHLKKTRGQMVLTGSVAGKKTLSGSVYGATKWFVRGYAGNLAEEMKAWGGRCALLAPGMVDTAFFDEPKPDALRPEDVAAAVMFALDQPEAARIDEIGIMPNPG